jgi:hypothetical protein
MVVKVFLTFHIMKETYLIKKALGLKEIFHIFPMSLKTFCSQSTKDCFKNPLLIAINFQKQFLAYKIILLRPNQIQ